MVAPIIGRRELARGAFVLEIERNEFGFTAGEHILLGIAGDIERREYSVYSSEQAETLEVLVKRVEHGAVSQQLGKAKIGELVSIEGPFGYFTVTPEQQNRRNILVATGSGIAPYHSYALTYDKLDYQIIHGTRYNDECYEIDCYIAERYIHCVSRESGGKWQGRVSDYIQAHSIDIGAHYYLCGNCDMIYEVFDILKNGGVELEQISAEVYF